MYTINLQVVISHCHVDLICDIFLHFYSRIRMVLLQSRNT